MRLIAVNDAAAQLAEIVRQAESGEEIILTQDEIPIAKIGPVSEISPCARRGSMKGMVLAIADDFDEIPQGFEAYVE